MLAFQDNRYVMELNLNEKKLKSKHELRDYQSIIEINDTAHYAIRVVCNASLDTFIFHKIEIFFKFEIKHLEMLLNDWFRKINNKSIKKYEMNEPPIDILQIIINFIFGKLK